MKKIIVIAMAALLSTASFAQSSKGVKAATKYCCPKCDECLTSAGNCSHHKTALVEEGKYYCPMHSDVTSDKPGKCTKCGMAMKKMDMETTTMYCCTQCGMTMSPVKGKCPHSTEAIMKDGELKCVVCQQKDGKCPKCGMAMEKVEIKKKKS
jgi:hypothetical protein